MTKIDDNAGRIGEFGVDNTLRSDESLLTLISRGSLGAPGSPTIKNKQKRTRESADLMNMLLYELYSNRDLKSFKNPFNVCGRTKKIYLSHALTFHKLGIDSVHRYEQRSANEIEIAVQSIPDRFIPKCNTTVNNDSDLTRIANRLYEIMDALNRLDLDVDSRVTFRIRAMTITDIVYATSAIIKLHKLIDEDVSLRSFMTGICDFEIDNQLDMYHQQLNVDTKTKKEADLNRRHIFAIRTLIQAIISIQMKHQTNYDVNLSKVDLRCSSWVDRFVSASLEV